MPCQRDVAKTLSNFSTPQIVKTDQVSQFTETEFTEVVLSSAERLSTDGRSTWRHYVFVVRLWHSIKYERDYLKAYDSVTAAHTDIAQCFDWCRTTAATFQCGRNDAV